MNWKGFLSLWILPSLGVMIGVLPIKLIDIYFLDNTLPPLWYFGVIGLVVMFVPSILVAFSDEEEEKEELS